MAATSRLSAPERRCQTGTNRCGTPLADARDCQQRAIVGCSFQRLECIDVQSVMDVACQSWSDTGQSLKYDLRRSFSAQPVELRQTARPGDFVDRGGKRTSPCNDSSTFAART
jgi:hypothetical protein